MQKPKGTYDVNGELGRKTIHILNLARTILDKYNYEYWRTPIFEASELFHRGVGETTDIVTKETYDFLDRGDRNMTLRPEGTAGIVRAYVENKYYGDANQPTKTWYYGPMYRYEKPQAGRFREFYQLGVEVFNSNDPSIDAEVISIPVNLYKMLGLKGIRVKINSLGDTESRLKYREALLEYFKPYIDDLCDDCKARYLKNPMRILDCKVDKDSDILKNAPKILDYLNDDSKKYFAEVLKHLDELEIEYEVDPNVVRGLDYYTHTVFEVETLSDKLGNQNVLCAGGRYNGLVKTIGDIDVPGVGFALGMERLISVLEIEGIDLETKPSLDVYVIPMDSSCKDYTVPLVQTLRLNGFKCDTDYLNRAFKSNFKQADRFNASFVIIVGSDEIKNQKLTVKDNNTHEEYKVDLDKIIEFLDEKLGDEHE